MNMDHTLLTSLLRSCLAVHRYLQSVVSRVVMVCGRYVGGRVHL